MKSLPSSSMAIFSFSYVYRNSTSWPKLFFRAPFYRPQRSCEGYVFTGVCLSTGRGGMSGRGVPGPGGCLVLEGVCAWSRGVPAPRGCLLPGRGGAWSRGGGGVGIPAYTEADPAGETTTAADGTHPTGMHSC